MTNLFSKYETDAGKELQGVAYRIDDAVFMIRRAGGHNRAWRYALTEAAKPHRADIDDDSISQGDKMNLIDDIERQAFVDSVLIDWEHVEGRDGHPLEFNRDNALDLLRSCPKVWDELKSAAMDDERFRIDQDGQHLGE